ncbi:hypothetical protein EVAR_75164_1 [Eumeta japonica]|uniref:Uncharacterized protein n=1 Tax=Eumeta variegata TaxID=151549 RepID=A0A4C1U0I9_EUMVA|nr:hypothetical protein EVAR_75164_1 [Eumeta japonica]
MGYGNYMDYQVAPAAHACICRALTSPHAHVRALPTVRCTRRLRRRRILVLLPAPPLLFSITIPRERGRTPNAFFHRARNAEGRSRTRLRSQRRRGVHNLVRDVSRFIREFHDLLASGAECLRTLSAYGATSDISLGLKRTPAPAINDAAVF